MASPTVENYLKAQWSLEQEVGSEESVALGNLARKLGVTGGTLTTMAKSLAADGYLDYKPRRGLKLTEKGTRAALDVLRRHRVVERFLVDVLCMDWSEVHAEAEQLEHAVSTKVLERMEALLGHPTRDPHGDPIPAADGSMAGEPVMPVHELEAGRSAVVVRVTDQAPGFLTLLADHGIRPGNRIHVRERLPASDAVALQAEGGGPPLALGMAAADRILVLAGQCASEPPTTS